MIARTFPARRTGDALGHVCLLLRSRAARRTAIACLYDPHAIALTVVRLGCFAPFHAYWTHRVFRAILSLIFMANDENALESTMAEDVKPVSFSDAARFLGVDVFTFSSMVQREEIPSFLGPWGEFVVSQSDLDKLVSQKDAPC